MAEFYKLNNRNKHTKLEYMIIGKVPVFSNGFSTTVYPKFMNLTVNEKEDKEYILIKKYKNKYNLSDKFFDDNFEEQSYYKVFENLFLNSSNNIFYCTNRSFEIDENSTLDNMLDDEMIKLLVDKYSVQTVKSLLEQIFTQTKDEYNSHGTDEDYEYYECMVVVIDRMIEHLFKSSQENLEAIYILQSLLYFSFYPFYYELYEYSKNNLLERL